jgi:hypothetical protein
MKRRFLQRQGANILIDPIELVEGSLMEKKYFNVLDSAHHWSKCLLGQINNPSLDD